MFAVSNIHGVGCLGNDIDFAVLGGEMGRRECAHAKSANMESASANSERLRYASLFGPFPRPRDDH